MRTVCLLLLRQYHRCWHQAQPHITRTSTAHTNVQAASMHVIGSVASGQAARGMYGRAGIRPPHQPTQARSSSTSLSSSCGPKQLAQAAISADVLPGHQQQIRLLQHNLMHKPSCTAAKRQRRAVNASAAVGSEVSTGQQPLLPGLLGKLAGLHAPLVLVTPGVDSNMSRLLQYSNSSSSYSRDACSQAAANSSRRRRKKQQQQPDPMTSGLPSSCDSDPLAADLAATQQWQLKPQKLAVGNRGSCTTDGLSQSQQASSDSSSDEEQQQRDQQLPLQTLQQQMSSLDGALQDSSAAESAAAAEASHIIISSCSSSSGSEGVISNSRHKRRTQQPQPEQTTLAESQCASEALASPASVYAADPQVAVNAPQQQQLLQQQQLPMNDICASTSSGGQNHQRDTATATRILLIGIDPDSNGALAVIAADLVSYKTAAASDSSSSSSGSSTDTSSSSNTISSSGGRSSSSNGSSNKKGSKHSNSDSGISDGDSNLQQQQQQQPLYVDLSTALISVYDMPVEVISMRKKTKSAPQRYRRRLDVSRAIATIRKILHQHQQLDSRLSSSISTLSSSGSSSNGSPFSTTTSSSSATSSSSSRPQVILRAILEVAAIVPTNGSIATLNQGFSLGAWTAALTALGFDISTVNVRQWKKDMGLIGLDKDCSRMLARAIFNAGGNCQDQLLSRKKDHGRAEALLLAAWGCGWSATDLAAANSSKKKSRSKAARPPSAATVSSSSSDGSSSDSRKPAEFKLQPGPLREVMQMDGGMHVLTQVPNGLDRDGEDLDVDDSYFSDEFLYGATTVEPAAPTKQKVKLSKSSRARSSSGRRKGEAQESQDAEV